MSYLPSLFLVQFFKDGKYAPLTEWQKMQPITFEICTSDAVAVTERVLTDIGIEYLSALIDYQYRNVAFKSGFKLLQGHILENSTRKPFELMIHEMELIRFYMTNSEYSC